MKIVLFSIFGFNVYSHGVFLVLAMLIGGWLTYRFARKSSLDTGRFFLNYLISLIVGILLSRLFFYLLNLNDYTSVWQMVQIWKGGLVSFAGFAAGALIFIWLLWRQNQQISPWLDIAGITFPLAIAIGRIGCVLNGEFGIRTKSVLAIYGYMPVTAFEIYICVAIFVLNLYLYNNRKIRQKLPPGSFFLNFLVLYSFSRLIIDSWRADTPLSIGINASQFVSLIIFLIPAIIYIIIIVREKRKSGQNEN